MINVRMLVMTNMDTHRATKCITETHPKQNNKKKRAKMHGHFSFRFITLCVRAFFTRYKFLVSLHWFCIFIWFISLLVDVAAAAALASLTHVIIQLSNEAFDWKFCSKFLGTGLSAALNLHILQMREIQVFSWIWPTVCVQCSCVERFVCKIDKLEIIFAWESFRWKRSSLSIDALHFHIQ